MFLWMQFSQNTNIFMNLFYRNTKQFFRHLGLYSLPDMFLHPASEKRHPHSLTAFEKLVPVPDLCVLSSKAYPVFLNNKADKKGGITEQNRSHKKHCTTLQTVHTGIDNIRPVQVPENTCSPEYLIFHRPDNSFFHPDLPASHRCVPL